MEHKPDVVFQYREGPGVSHGVNWALAAKGVIIKDKAFTNLKPSELKQRGAVVVGELKVIHFWPFF